MDNQIDGLEEIGTGAIYLSVSNGRVSRYVKQPTAKSVQRVNKNGVTVNEEFYGSVTGLITDIKTKEREGYGKQWQIYLQKGDNTLILSFNYSSSYASSFFKALPNVNVAKEVKLTPWQKEINGKKKSAIYINQCGSNDSVEWFYTREDPKGLPPLEKIKIKGVEQWDDSKQTEFFENYVNTVFLPKLNGSGEQLLDLEETPF